MWLLWIGVLMVLAKWLGFGPVAELSWWWVLAPLAGALVWFEGLEKLFGRDRRKVDSVLWEKRRKERVAEQFKQPPTAGDPKAAGAARPPRR